MTIMVRQLAPTPDGLPIEIYAFTNVTAWIAYEQIQSDIFDHLFAILPQFHLRVHQTPTGFDMRGIAAHFAVRESESERGTVVGVKIHILPVDFRPRISLRCG